MEAAQHLSGLRAAVVADDLTGANVTASLLVRDGFRCRVTSDDPNALSSPTNCDVALIYTDSRTLPESEAYRRVASAVDALGADIPWLFSKRIDSTARGNLGSEIQAAMDRLNRRTALVVLADPANGKITSGGQLLIGGIAVDRTFAASDPVTPVTTSAVVELMQRQSSYPVYSVSAELIRQGPHPVTDHVRSFGTGHKIVLFDCTNDDELDTIAQAALMLGEPFVAADPGPFTARLARLHLRRWPRRPVFLVCGSVQPNVRSQLDELQRQVHARLLEIPADLLSGRPDDESLQWLRSNLLQSPAPEVLGVYSSFHQAPVDRADTIAQSVARLAARLFAEMPVTPAGLILTGGQTAHAFCSAIGVHGVEVVGEVIPYAAVGLCLGGKWVNLPVITKGGLIGDQSALIRCVRYIQNLWRDSV